MFFILQLRIKLHSLFLHVTKKFFRKWINCINCITSNSDKLTCYYSTFDSSILRYLLLITSFLTHKLHSILINLVKFIFVPYIFRKQKSHTSIHHCVPTNSNLTFSSHNRKYIQVQHMKLNWSMNLVFVGYKTGATYEINPSMQLLVWIVLKIFSHVTLNLDYFPPISIDVSCSSWWWT